jgi:hypothetical protein
MHIVGVYRSLTSENFYLYDCHYTCCCQRKHPADTCTLELHQVLRDFPEQMPLIACSSLQTHTIPPVTTPHFHPALHTVRR